MSPTASEDFSVVRRGISALQPGARQSDGRLLLVGVGTDVRLDSNPFGLGNPPVVLPMVPVTVMATGLVALFAVLNLRGMRRVTTAATWIAAGSAALALCSGQSFRSSPETLIGRKRRRSI